MNDLQERLSTDKIVGLLSDSLRSVGADLATSVSETIRKNPVPAALVGFGLAWLAASAAKRDADDDGHMPRPSRDGLGASADFGAHRPLGHPTAFRQADEHNPSPDGFMADLRTRAAHLTTHATEGIEALAQKLATGTDDMTSAAHRAAQSLARSAWKEPLAIGGATLVGGAIVGAMLPATDHEDRAIGVYRDQLFDQTERAFAEERRKLGTTAAAAVDAAATAVAGILADDPASAAPARQTLAQGSTATSA
jgi:hypothetical protein